jgi:Gas vesicle synthesis protein GvpO
MAERRRVHADGGQAADPPPLTAAEVGRYGIRQIAELTGKEPEGVTGVEPADDGWIVTVEVVETRRIPASTDLLATYETEIGPDGDLVAYRRVRRYARGRGDSAREDG